MFVRFDDYCTFLAKIFKTMTNSRKRSVQHVLKLYRQNDEIMPLTKQVCQVDVQQVMPHDIISCVSKRLAALVCSPQSNDRFATTVTVVKRN